MIEIKPEFRASNHRNFSKYLACINTLLLSKRDVTFITIRCQHSDYM